MKYIDAEKLIAEIERRRSEAEKTFNHIFEYASSAKEISEWVSREYNNILSYIDSLQQEHPSLPSDIDKAAKQIVIQKHPCMEDCLILGDRLTRGELIALVKAGIEWMAGQGVTAGATFHHSCGYPSVIELNTYLRDYEGKEVIVQVRKKQ